MSKNLFHLICWFPLLLCCNRAIECNGIKNDQYSGHAIVFYHMPVSGSSYEVIILPICGDTSELVTRIQDSIKKVKILDGVDCTLGSRRDSHFAKVFEKSQKIKLLNNQTLASEYKTIYACPVYIEFKNVKNITQSVTGSQQDALHEKLTFENGQQLTLDYFLSGTLEVTKLRVL